MDFIEKLFHVSPDGGSGAYEVLVVALVGAFVLAIAMRGYLRTSTSRKKKTMKK